jgi:hypothetical protein
MTKKELVEVLSQFDDDMLILIPGYVTSSHVMKIPDAHWYDGEYEVSKDSQLTPNAILLYPIKRENG